MIKLIFKDIMIQWLSRYIVFYMDDIVIKIYIIHPDPL